MRPLAERLQPALIREQGLTVKDLAQGLELNQQFMSGFPAAVEERGEVSCRKVRPARIYFVSRTAGAG